MTMHRSPIRAFTAACGRIGLAALMRSAAGLALPLALAAGSAPARAEVYVVRPPVAIRSHRARRRAGSRNRCVRRRSLDRAAQPGTVPAIP